MRRSVIVVEDDDLTRSLLVALLRGHGVDVVADTGSVATALRLTEEHRIDAALLDLDLGPGPSGLDLARELRERDPLIGLVLLTTYRDPRLKDPAAGSLPRGLVYLSKREGTDASAVLGALRAAMAAPLASPTPPQRTELTETQIEVLAGVAAGRTTAQIARDRGVSAKAVEQVISRLTEIFDIPRDDATNQRVRLAAAYHQLTGQSPS